jgi:hypothetical protein
MTLGGDGVFVTQSKEARLFEAKHRPSSGALDQERHHDLFPESKTPLLSYFSGQRTQRCYHRRPDNYFPREFSEDVREHLRKEREQEANAEYRDRAPQRWPALPMP